MNQFSYVCKKKRGVKSRIKDLQFLSCIVYFLDYVLSCTYDSTCLLKNVYVLEVEVLSTCSNNDKISSDLVAAVLNKSNVIGSKQ